jgi:hypothetical protein
MQAISSSFLLFHAIYLEKKKDLLKLEQPNINITIKTPPSYDVRSSYTISHEYHTESSLHLKHQWTAYCNHNIVTIYGRERGLDWIY